jgi:cytochrome P450
MNETTVAAEARDGATEPGLVEVFGYRDAIELFRSDKMSTAVGTERDAEIFRGGVLTRLHGEDHLRRRKLLNRLVRRDGHKWFRDNHLFPTIDRTVEELLAHPDADGVVRADLVKLVHRVNVQLGAAVAGIDVTTAEETEDLLELMDEMSKYSSIAEREVMLRLVPGPEVPAADASGAKAAKEQFVERFFVPSLARRRALVASVAIGEITEEDLPHDVMTFIASDADPDYREPGLAAREVLLFVRSAIGTSSHAISYAAVDIDAWCKAHPEDLPLRTDPEFILGALNESLRLRILTPRLRLAMEDVTLTSGLHIKAGQYVNIRTPEASRDPDAYGPDAHVFNPRRQVESGVYANGLAFGSGRHMCLGLPLVLGSEGLDGSLVHTLRSFYEAGMELDPSLAATRREGALFEAISEDRLDTCPIIFRP